MRNKATKKKRIRLVFIILGCCCIVAAAALAAYNWWDSNRAAVRAQELTNSMVQLLTAGKPDDEELGYEIDEGLVHTPDDDDDEVEEDMSYITVEGHNVCGSVNIPSININLAIIHEWSYPNLEVTACRYSGSPKSGNLILLAHNYEKHFGLIGTLVPGDVVEFTDIFGEVYRYEVAGTETWGTYQLSDIIAGEDEWDLTLFTCTYGGASRVTVRCVQIDE